MIVLELDDAVSVTVAPSPPDWIAYGVVFEGETVAEYETSADLRTDAGRVSVRNVVYRNVPNYEKSAVEAMLATAIADRATDISEALGPA